MPKRPDDTWWWVKYDPDGPVFKITTGTRQTVKWEVANWEGDRWHFTGDEYPYDDCEIGEVGPQVIQPPELSI